MNLTYVLLHFLLRCEILGADMTHDVVLFMHILFSIFARNFCWCSNSLEYQPITLKSDNRQIHFYHFLVLENLLRSRKKRHSHLFGIVFHFVAFFVIVHMDEFILYSGTLYYFFFYSARPALLVQLKLLWVAAAWINPIPWSIFYCFHMVKFNGKSTELFMFSSFMCFQIVYSLNSFYKYSKRKRKSIKNGNGNILHYYKNLNVNRIGKANRNAKLVLTIWRMKESMSMRSLIKFLSGAGQRKDGLEGLYESSFPATDFYSRDFTDMII